jgi:hypothetical protein
MAIRETRGRPAATVGRSPPASNRAMQRAAPAPVARARAARTPGLLDAMMRSIGESMREGRDAAIADAKAASREIRDRPPRSCRAEGRRYDGCPLDTLGL